MEIKKKLFFLLLILIVLPLIYAASYSSGTYGNGIYGGIDIDSDEIEDDSDNLLYNKTYVTTSGITQLNISIEGQKAHGSFNENKEVLFYDQNDLIVNFTHNFSQSNILDLSKIEIQKASTYIIVNFSGQLQRNKTVYIDDNSFTSLCVKDEEIDSIDRMSSGCDGSNETDFTTCLGNSNISLNGITCTDEGSKIRVENLQYSAIRGAISDEIVDDGGGGGGGGTGRAIQKTETFSIDKDTINVKLPLGGTKKEEIVISSSETAEISISVSKIEDFIKISEKEFSLKDGESKKITLDFLVREDVVPGLYLGKLIVKSKTEEKEILVVIEVVSLEELLDVAIEIKEGPLSPGQEIWTSVKLINFGATGRIDAELEYEIISIDGESILKEKEFRAVETETSFLKILKIPYDAEYGKYIFYVKANYEEYTASASKMFEIEKSKVTNLNKLLIYFGIAFFFILIIYMIFELILIRVRLKRYSKSKISEKDIFKKGLKKLKGGKKKK